MKTLSISRIAETYRTYPQQLWTLLTGHALNTAATFLIQPFLLVYFRETLNVPVSTLAAVLATASLLGIPSRLVAGPLVDKFGRKWGMIIAFLSQSVLMAAMPLARTLESFAVLAILLAVLTPMAILAVRTMVADLVSVERRASSFALESVSYNVAAALGPVIGGLAIAFSYGSAFMLSAAFAAIAATVAFFFLRETNPTADTAQKKSKWLEGYGQVVRDRFFLGFMVANTLMILGYAQMFIYLPLYIKENFGIPESGAGFLIATNAAMVILFQYGVTRSLERRPRLYVMAVGSLLIALGLGTVSLFSIYPLFFLSMVIYSLGELMAMPTASAYVADVAPPNLRGTYMGILNLTFALGYGLGPMVGGILNDRVGPAAIWYGALAMGLLATMGFLVIRLLSKSESGSPASTAERGEPRAEMRVESMEEKQAG